MRESKGMEVGTAVEESEGYYLPDERAGEGERGDRERTALEMNKSAQPREMAGYSDCTKFRRNTVEN